MLANVVVQPLSPVQVTSPVHRRGREASRSQAAATPCTRHPSSPTTRRRRSRGA